LRAGLLGEATGSPTAFRGDVVATAKRDLRVGETLDGEGGYCVYGRLLPAAASLRAGALPIGLAHGIELTQDVKAGETLRWSDVALGLDDPTVRFRKEMEARFARFKV
jgi:predicted homoserine dehydrogenase-like protein